MRYFLLTWTTYGTWLPGDRRGFVSSVKDGPGPQFRHNVPRTPYDADLPGLRESARRQMKGNPIYLSVQQANVVLDQFLETTRYRQWDLLAAAVMNNHVHLVVGAKEVTPEKMMADFKAYGSRALSNLATKSKSQKWWATSGSKRWLPTDRAIQDAVQYVRNQPYCLSSFTRA